MTASRSSSQRAKNGGSSTAKSRTFSGAIAGVLGFVAMSAVAGVLVTASVVPVVALGSSGADTAISIFDNLPDNMRFGELAQASTLYAKEGDGYTAFATFFDQDRIEVGSDAISPFAKDAAVAVEDPRFLEHGGVDMISMSRAIITNTLGIGNKSGASTISMQVVKNILVQRAESKINKEERDAAYADATREDADRKLKEMKLAIGLEKTYTKDEILQQYLNIALFGRRVYGIEAASQYYFGISAKDLSLSQAASLVGTVNNPERFRIDKPENIPANTERRDNVLAAMLKNEKITQEQYDAAVAEVVTPSITPRQSGCMTASGLAFFCDYIQRAIKQDPKFGNDEDERSFNFSRGGLSVYTTIDMDMQRAAEAAMQENVAPNIPNIDVGATAVSTDTQNGNILAMTQNRPYDAEGTGDPNTTQINYNTDYSYGGSSGFQVGSTFKAFTLAEWIRTGHSVREIVDTTPGTVKEKDFKANCLPDGVYGFGTAKFDNATRAKGNKTVLEATAQSINGGFVSMAKKMDLCNIVDMAEGLGVHRASPDMTPDSTNNGKTTLKPNISILYGGTEEIAPMTMALAYGAFAADGKVCGANAIQRITDSSGQDKDFTKSTCRQAIEPRVAAGVAYALEYSITNGLASSARSSTGIHHLAKTGTTDNYVDNWIVGASTSVSTAVWVGNVNGKVDTRYIPGLETSKNRIWPAIMNVADAKYPGTAFPAPDKPSNTTPTTKIPDTAGKTYEEAVALLEPLGFTVTDGGEQDSNQPAGKVAGTDPAAGTDAPTGAPVTIYRSNAAMIAVPTLYDRWDRSAQELRNAGFTTAPAATCQDGTGVMPKKESDRILAASTPQAGELARSDSQITFVIKCPAQ